MNIRNLGLAVAAAGLAGFAALSPAAALSLKECSAKYQAAKDGKTLNGQSWNDFQRLQCADDAKPAKATDTKPAAPAAKPAETKPAAKVETKPAAPAPAPAAAATGIKLSAKECSAKYKADKAANALGGLKWNDYRKAKCGYEPAAKAAAAPVASGPAVFPASVSSKYSSEKPGKARMHTCLDQYRANKATGGNGGMTWISRKGGGYYSACNKKLKGL